ncbi:MULTISPECIES: hypothetical protein [Pseudomonas]|uniref:Uncharacterized protein n=1 Tax=Pseudomonas cedrina TaxID=651740 RepID=A0A2S9E2G4_PSECE|nr:MULTISPECIES: hypothetical protein [Pseudomonas]AVJ20980.1 hypothetical protein CLM72_04185 [Pseudomonas sp. MYb193]PRC09024.1 hypothetical protein CQ006_04770 [Pseudomonas cedrina]
MALQVDEVAVTGGFRIIDTDRIQAYQGIAIVVQRDAHPVIADCEITHAEALATAKAMAAARDLLESLTNLVGLAKLGAAHLSKYHAALAHAEAVIAKATA